ncbi:AI-2E family transporter [Nocardioides humi]|uniref:AI-2E family transporter n=1 Tax=Nocardioides humi TaxID=449461 RepID=A0ABN2AS99_9ACTN|nr:AI-2E family transporter [Nocardioides humi]
MSGPDRPDTATDDDGVSEHAGVDPAAATPAPAPSAYGEPGKPFDRRSPFFYGFVGALGALTAFWLFNALLGIGSTLMLIVVAFFLAAGLNPAVEFLERRGLRRSLAVVVVIVIALAVVGMFLIAIVPVITDQVTALSKNVPLWIDELERNKKVQDLNEEYGILDKITSFVTDGDFISTLFGGALGVGLKVIGALFNAFVIFVLTLYFLASLKTTTGAVYKLAPASRRERFSSLGDKVIANVGGYVSGAFLVALCAGLSSLVFLYFTEVRQYAVALAFVVALLDVIPMIGATLGAVLVSAIAFATDLKSGIACVIFFVIYQQFENYVVYPRVMSKSVDLPGAVIVIAALIGAGLLGVVGALLAIPAAAAVLLIFREVVVRRQDLR